MRTITPLTVLALTAFALGSAAFFVHPALAPAAAVSPAIAFEPGEFEMDSSSYDHLGTLSYVDDKHVSPEPVPPQKGYLNCDDGYTVDLKVSAGPYDKGRIADHYTVLAQSIVPFTPPKGTVLKCSSEWGLYSSTKNEFLGTTTLYATIVYDTGIVALEFEPGTVTLAAGSAAYAGTLAYDSVASGGIKPIPSSGGYLDCGNGVTVPLHVKAGPDDEGTVKDTYTIDPPTSVPSGSTLTCSSTWGAYTKSGVLLGKGTLDVSITGS